MISTIQYVLWSSSNIAGSTLSSQAAGRRRIQSLFPRSDTQRKYHVFMTYTTSLLLTSFELLFSPAVKQNTWQRRGSVRTEYAGCLLDEQELSNYILPNLPLGEQDHVRSTLATSDTPTHGSALACLSLTECMMI